MTCEFKFSLVEVRPGTLVLFSVKWPRHSVLELKLLSRTCTQVPSDPGMAEYLACTIAMWELIIE